MLLNQNSPVPLYHQLAQLLRADIDRGDIAVNEKIPSETELARQYAIGRPTVRQATDLLVRDGMLERRRGSGTYVLPPTRRIDLFSLAGTSAALQGLPYAVHTELLAPLNRVTGPDHLPGRLAGKPVFELQRRSRIDDEAVLTETIYLDAGLFAGLEQLNLQHASLARIAREHFFLEATSAEQTFKILLADKAQAELLGIKQDTPVLGVSRCIHFGDQREAVFSDIRCLTERYHFTQTLTAPGGQS